MKTIIPNILGLYVEISFLIVFQKVGSSRTVSECSSVSKPDSLRSEEVADCAQRTSLSENESTQSTQEQTGAETVKCSESESKECNTDETLQDNCEETEVSNDRVTETGDNDTSKQVQESQDGEVIQAEDIGEETDSEDGEDEDDEEEDDDDDDDGWITPSNIKAVKEKMGGETMEKAVVQVGCLTTDFAMQVWATAV